MITTPVPSWLTIEQRAAPLLVSLPHTGTDLPEGFEDRLVSPWLARKDADWWIDRLYAFAADLGATVVRTAISRTVIDVNRDPSGQSLYPGQATTGLCPTTSFDGEPLYRTGAEPDEAEIAARRTVYFEPYHAALRAEITRLKAQHGTIVVYDCHSIRSVIPRLFEGVLPVFNLGTNDGRSAAPALTQAIEGVIARTGLPQVTNGRFKGGWITRSCGRPNEEVHAVQMELACRGYMDEPAEPDPDTWPTPWSTARAAPLRQTLQQVLEACLAFAEARPTAG